MSTDGTWTDLPEPWFAKAGVTNGRRPGGPHWNELITALRHAQDEIAGCDPTDEIVLEATRRLEDVADLLRPWHVPEDVQAYGRRVEYPSWGQHLRPEVQLTGWTRFSMEATVTFTRVYLGAGHAVHGGVVAMVFDNFLGDLSQTGGRTPCRTAYLHVDYRNLTPLDTELVLEGQFVRESGRKRIVSASIRHGNIVCAEAEGLFIELRAPLPD